MLFNIINHVKVDGVDLLIKVELSVFRSVWSSLHSYCLCQNHCITVSLPFIFLKLLCQKQQKQNNKIIARCHDVIHVTNTHRADPYAVNKLRIIIHDWQSIQQKEGKLNFKQ